MHSAVRIGVLVLATVAVAGVATAQGGPKLEVENLIADLGEVPQGDVRDVSFTLKNTGNEPLVIKAVRPTCGCTVVDYDKEIAAGETGEVHAKLDTAGFKGAISKSVLVMTDDPISPTTTLAIKAVVKPFIEILPRPLVRFNALQMETVEQKVTIAATDRTKGFKVTDVSSDSEVIEPVVRKLGADELVAGKPEPQYELALTLSDEAPVGPLNTVVTVETDHPKAEKLQIRVFGVVRALLQVSPPELQFGAVKAAEKPARNLVVMNNKVGETIEVTGASVDDPAFTAQVQEVEQGRRYHVTVAVAPEAEGGLKDAVLTLTTTSQDMPKLEVPIRANLR